jgi:hypothetical protein
MARFLDFLRARWELAERRARIAKEFQESRKYHMQASYIEINENQTQRHCYNHPQNVATHFELNIQDKSYKRPVCSGCVPA